MNWRITDHTDNVAVVQFEDGRVLNYDITPLVEPPAHPALPGGGLLPAARPQVLEYSFAAGQEIPAHAHDARTVHDVYVVSGSVLVTRAVSGDVTLHAGDTARIEVGEVHSVKAIEPSVTRHTLLN